MSEKLLKFLLSELRTIRICCKGKRLNGAECGAVFEFRLEHLSAAFPNKCECPFCQTTFQAATAEHPFRLLSESLERLAKLKTLEVEFVMPDVN